MVVFHRIFPFVYALFCLPKSILLIYYDRICHHSKKPERNFLPDFSITFLFNFHRYVQILHFFYISSSSLRLLISISGRIPVSFALFPLFSQQVWIPYAAAPAISVWIESPTIRQLSGLTGIF